MQFQIKIIILILVASNTACLDIGQDETLSRDAKWNADIDAFTKGLKRTHPDPFHSMNENDFNRELVKLRAAIPSLSDQEVLVEVMKLTAAIAAQRDGHSVVLPKSVMPIQLYLFLDGFFIVNAAHEFRQLIGARVLEIGGAKIDEVMERVAPLLTRDNSAMVLARLPMFIMMPDLLRGLNLWNEEAPNLLIEKEGRKEGVYIEPIALRSLSFSLPPRGNTLWLKVPMSKESPTTRQVHFFQELLSPDVLYIQYNVVSSENPDDGESLKKFSRRIKDAVADGDVTKVIVDVRHNSGGDNTTYGPLLDVLSTPDINRHGKLYLLTSQVTYSAAGNFVTELEKNTRVILVGEPSGGSPNQFGDSRPIKLPYTKQLAVYISSRYHQKGVPDEERLIHSVDVPVSLSSADYFSGHDPVLEAALQDIASPLVRERKSKVIR